MARKKRLRCRVTAHMQGGARPGDIVEIDPTDPWMAARIPKYLVPLDPNWRPDEPTPEPATEPHEAPGASESTEAAPAAVPEGA